MTFSPYAERPKIFLEEARQEMKRAEHLMFVSLKYTRTVDVIRSIVERLINGLEEAITAGLLYAKEDNPAMDEIPTNMGLKIKMFREIYNGEITEEMLPFLQFLKRVAKAEYHASKEFRRHVTLTVMLDEGLLHIDIDKIKEYYERTKVYVEKMEFLFSGQMPQ